MENKLLMFCFLIFVLVPMHGDCFSLLGNRRLGNENPCSLPPDGGTCYADFVKYFYNSSSGRCETFIYKGCGGNENNFWTEEQCEGVCGEADSDEGESNSLFRVSLTTSSRARDVCDYPKETGVCYASIRRYYFNGETCEQFTYGGCGGNPNNFRTRKACMDKCGHRLDIGSGEAEEENLLSVSLF